jgi:hypothetical protein
MAHSMIHIPTSYMILLPFLKVLLMPPSGFADGTLRYPDSPPAASMLTDPGSPGPPTLPAWV